MHVTLSAFFLSQILLDRDKKQLCQFYTFIVIFNLFPTFKIFLRFMRIIIIEK